MKVFLLLFFLFSQATALAFADIDTQLSQVQSKIKTLADNLSRLIKQKGDASSELQLVEQQYGEISRTVKTLNQNMTLKQQRIDEIQQEIQVHNGQLLMQQSQLEEQVKAAYALGRQEQLKLMFNQQDISRSSRIMTYYQYFNQARLDALQQIDTSLVLLTNLEQEKQLEKQELTGLVAENKLLQQQLLLSKAERKKLLAKIKRDYQQSNTQLSRLKKNEQHLKKLITAIEAKKQVVVVATPAPVKRALSFAKSKGKLPWPVAGKIVRSFGSQRGEGRWNGVLIRAKEGTKIKAIAPGQVVFSDWFKGYGLLVIIQHDKNYMSLYAFNQSLYKKAGESVHTGDTIATLGNSGGRDKSELYFEIRKKNKALNPKQWCKKQR